MASAAISRAQPLSSAVALLGRRVARAGARRRWRDAEPAAGTRPGRAGRRRRHRQRRRARRCARKSTWAERSTSPGATSGSAAAWRLTARKVSPVIIGRVAAIVDQQRHAALAHEPQRRSPRPRPRGPGRARAGCRRAGRPSTPPTACGNGVARGRHDEAEGAVLRRRRPAARASGRTGARTAAPAGRPGTRWRPAAAAGPSAGRPARRASAPAGRQGGRLPLAQGRAGLDQMDRRGSARTRAPPSPRAARRPSACRAPGPSSTTATRPGRPRSSQCCTRARPISSPNSWLISGAVTKSPGGAQGIAARIVARRGMRQRQRHVAGDRDRAVVEDQPAQPVLESAQPSASTRRRRAHDQEDAEGQHRQGQELAHGDPAGEVADLHVGLAEELDRDPGQRVADQEDAAEQAARLGAVAAGARARASPRTGRGPRARPRRAGWDGAAPARRWGRPRPRARRWPGPTARR